MKVIVNGTSPILNCCSYERFACKNLIHLTDDGTPVVNFFGGGHADVFLDENGNVSYSGLGAGVRGRFYKVTSPFKYMEIIGETTFGALKGYQIISCSGKIYLYNGRLIDRMGLYSGLKDHNPAQKVKILCFAKIIAEVPRYVKGFTSGD